MESITNGVLSNCDWQQFQLSSWMLQNVSETETSKTMKTAGDANLVVHRHDSLKSYCFIKHHKHDGGLL